MPLMYETQRRPQLHSYIKCAIRLRRPLRGRFVYVRPLILAIRCCQRLARQVANSCISRLYGSDGTFESHLMYVHRCRRSTATKIKLRCIPVGRTSVDLLRCEGRFLTCSCTLVFACPQAQRRDRRLHVSVCYCARMSSRASEALAIVEEPPSVRLAKKRPGSATGALEELITVGLLVWDSPVPRGDLALHGVVAELAGEVLDRLHAHRGDDHAEQGK